MGAKTAIKFLRKQNVGSNIRIITCESLKQIADFIEQQEKKIDDLEKFKRHVDGGYMCAMCRAERGGENDQPPKEQLR